MKKQFDEYYIGLDIGTDSVGYAVTDLNYKVQKINGKAMWGVRLFDAGKTAAERRTFRIARRLNSRKSQRLSLLRALFKSEIDKVDPHFFQRLQDSKFLKDDKDVFQPYTLFNDADIEGLTDKDFHAEFPTIYHLRKTLIETNQKYDIRLVYLACHHMIKNRGHFLLQSGDIKGVGDFNDYYQNLVEVLRNELDINIELDEMGIENFKAIITNNELTRSDKSKQLIEALSLTTPQQKEIAKFLSGNMGKLSTLYSDDALEESEFNKLKLAESKYEENEDAIHNLLEDRMYVISVIKSIYDWSILQDILKDYEFLSQAKVASYDEHHQDLVALKKAFKTHLSKKDYQTFFMDHKQNDNYVAYVGSTNKNGKRLKAEKRCTQESLCGKVKKILAPIKEQDQETFNLYRKAEEGTLLPKQVTKNNSVIPNQVHKRELTRILENASTHYPFLTSADENTLSITDKIISILTFRIPYYVGPLNPAHSVSGKTKQNDGSHHAWIKKLSDEKIYPWNFDKVVDIEASAERFILNMTNQCSYLLGEDVLPKQSLLYSEFMVRNEINNLKVNGNPLASNVKDAIYRDLFECPGRITPKKINDYLIANGHIAKDDKVTGIDTTIKSSLKSYHDFMRILGKQTLVENLTRVEDMIRYITLFGDDRKLLKSRLKKNYHDIFDANQIDEIAKLKYTGWGRLSHKLLTGISHVEQATGIEQSISIIENMKLKGKNLMELLSDAYTYSAKIKQANKQTQGDVNRISYRLVDDMYVSPAIKRGIWQTLLIVKELVKIMGHAPKRIFVEVARGAEEKKRTHSRKKQLLELYKSIKNEMVNWKDSINRHSDSELRSKKLYLYYLQMGKCMYSGQTIDLYQLMKSNSVYDIDHIYPRSKVKDDSFGNLVLVDKRINAYKSDDYPIDPTIQKDRIGLWKMLLVKGLLTQKKFDRLTRSSELSADELADFIARQLVETRQSTKAVAQLLGQVYDKSEIVYVKAGNVSDFRKKYDMIKVREVNDIHHAKDAYLNIVVGNVYHTKFTTNPRNFMRDVQLGKERYSLNWMYRYPVERGGIVAWRVDGANPSMDMVKRMMRKNNVQFTRYAYTNKGGFYKQMPLKKGKGQFPLKTKDNRFRDIGRYGGYDKVSGAFFALLSYKKKNKQVIALESIPYVYKSQYMLGGVSRDKVIKDYLQIENYKIVIPVVKIDSVIEIDGTRYFISGRTSNQIVLKYAHQFILDYKDSKFIKQLGKIIEKKKNGQSVDIDLSLLNPEKLLRLYKLLIAKLRIAIYYNKLSKQYSDLSSFEDTFRNADTYAKVYTLMQIMKFFQTNAALSDLSLIGGGGQAGMLRTSKYLNNNQKCIIINQSVSGLFESFTNII